MTIQSRTQVLQKLFSCFDRYEIEYCVVGVSKDLPLSIPSDIDIIISGDKLSTIEVTLASFAKINQMQLTQVLQHEQTAFYFVLSFKTETTRYGHICPDICSDYHRNGKVFLSAQSILKNRQRAMTESGQDKGFYIPSPPNEFLYYLIKKVDKGDINQYHFDHLQDQFNKSPEQCRRNTEIFWTHEQATKIITCIQTDNLAALQKEMPRLQQTLARNSRPGFRERRNEFKRLIKRIIYPTGIVIGLLGPDGCGKSTIGDRLTEEIAPVFRGVRRFHLWPDLFGRNKPGNAHVVTEPHGQKPRGTFMSVCKLFYFIIEYCAGYFLKVKPLAIRSHLVVFDRYFHDILIDPVRYRFGAPLWLARLCSLFIPKPDLFIVFDAPAKVIHTRKQEVSLAESERQRGEYLAFARNHHNCIVVNTNQDISLSVADTSRQILNHMEKRLEKRSGKYNPV